MNIQDVIKKWEEIKKDISPFPWFINGRCQVNNMAGFICSTYNEKSDHDCEQEPNSEFIAQSPEVINTLVEGMKKAAVSLNKIAAWGQGDVEGNFSEPFSMKQARQTLKELGFND